MGRIYRVLDITYDGINWIPPTKKETDAIGFPPCSIHYCQNWPIQCDGSYFILDVALNLTVHLEKQSD